MMVNAEYSCPVCTSGRARAIFTPNPHHKLFKCERCNHIFVPKMAFPTDKNQQVQLEYFDETFAARVGVFVNFYEHLNARRTVQALGHVNGRDVLEIGPGSGAIMAWLSRLGNEVRGLDVSSFVAKQIKQRWDLPVFVETLDEHVRVAGKGIYEVIVMRHVLEHFTDPYHALTSVYDLLKPGGQLYIAVPNVGSWHNGYSGWSGYEPYHSQFFCQKSLAHVLNRAGFRVSKMASYESLTGWANTLLHSVLGQRKSSGKKETSKVNWKRHILEMARLIIGILLFPVRLLQSLLGRGDELIAVAKKEI